MSGANIPVPVTLANREACKAASLLRRVGERWTTLVVAVLHKRTYRFNELHRAMEGLSQRMLTRTLRGLERDGLVSRTVHPTVPPTVEYALTTVGHEFYAHLETLGLWVYSRAEEIDAARTQFDGLVHLSGSPAGHQQ
jgi:DNA-binding HxlR family transcriptional regulator